MLTVPAERQCEERDGRGAEWLERSREGREGERGRDDVKSGRDEGKRQRKGQRK